MRMEKSNCFISYNNLGPFIKLATSYHLCYDSAPRGEPLLPENTPRSKLPENSTAILFSWHNGL
jgi:hypothetical protein